MALTPRRVWSTSDPVELQRELVDFQKELLDQLALLGARARLRAATTDDVFANYGDILRLSPDSGGQTLTLPPATPAVAGARVTATIESDDGVVTIQVVDGLINQEESVALPALSQLVEFVCDGVGWYQAAAPLTDILDASFGSTRGSLLIRGASGWQILAPGTVDLPLLSNGAGADPSYRSSPIGGRSSITSNATATNATTVLTAASYTIPANELVVGSIWRVTAWFDYTHTAAATPTLTIQLRIAGSSIVSRVIDPPAVATTYAGHISAGFTVRSTGAAGTLMPAFFLLMGDNTAAEQWGGASVETADVAVDTTVNRDLDLVVFMTTAVPSNTLTISQGYVERVL